MTEWIRIKKSFLCFVAAAILMQLPTADYAGAQNSSSQQEVYLTFQYRGIVSSYITAYYKDGEFYLPIGELFNVLEIDHHIDIASLTVSGLYLGEIPYEIYLASRILKARAGDTELELTSDDVIVNEIGYFLKPVIFERLFGLTFTVDFNNLTLNLDTSDRMPVVARYEREQKRKQAGQNRPRFERSYHPLQFDRQYGLIDGGFIDYNISGIYTPNTQLFTFSNAIGTEFLGGDVQGNTFGSISDKRSDFTTDNLRWRYVQRDSRIFSHAMIGQINTEGIAGRSITGAQITNKPVEPRLLFDRYVIDGTATPRSEVELYLNNSLIDYQETDQSGNYRFVVPLTYGSTNYALRIFKPSGQTVERNTRIQIPFDFVPPGDVDYSISGGRLTNPILGSTERGYVGEATFSTGITSWLTARASTEYLSNYHDTYPSFTGTINARLFSNYLLSLNANSENFYRLSTSVVYSGGTSLNVDYDYNPGDSRLYNVGGYEHQARVNLFTPFRIGSVPLNVRWSSTYQQRDFTEQLRYRADLNTRLGRLNVRFGYRDQQAGDLQFTSTPGARLINSYTYSVGRQPGIPAYLKGTFIRGQLSYLPVLDRLEEMEVQVSRDILRTGRIQLAYGHNFISRIHSFSLNLTIDFNKVRSNTTSRSTGGDYSISQNLRGSLAFDRNNGRMLLYNRQQVGQSGAAVRLFVDNDNDGAYQSDTDELIDDPAIRMNRSGGRTEAVRGINYITQLLPYYRYDLEVNKSRLSNPLLVPEIENFSIITDPNQFKSIDIPFYLSGVISGMVQRKERGNSRGISGVRLYLESVDDPDRTRDPHREEIRTFSDGSFYTYEVPPGKYHLYVDPDQLQYLNGRIEPDTMQIEVRSLAEGDFIEGLVFNVIPEQDETEESVTLTEEPEPYTGERIYQIQLGSYSSRERADRVRRQASDNLQEDFTIVLNTRNNLYAVRSAPIYDRNEALGRILAYHNSSYTDAALVVLQNPDFALYRADNRERRIQIGAFRDRGRAEKFAALSRIKLGRRVTLTYEEDIGLNTVFIDPSDNRENRQNLRQLLSEIRSGGYYSDAFIKYDGTVPDTPGNARSMEFAYQVHIEGVTEDSEQAFMSGLLDNDTDTQLNQPEKNLFIFDNVSSWDEAQDFQKQLARISSIGRPIVVLIEKSLMDED